MTNDKTVTMSRELLEALLNADSVEQHRNVHEELRAILTGHSAEPTLREHSKQCAEVVKTWPESKRDCLGKVEPVVERQPKPCEHEWTDDGGFLLICTACGAQEDFEQALQLAFELGGTDDGAYLLEADELCEVIRRFTAPPAPATVVLPERQEVESGEAYLQEDWVSGWNACLDKVKELNQ